MVDLIISICVGDWCATIALSVCSMCGQGS